MSQPKQTISELIAENARLRQEVTRLTELHSNISYMRDKYKQLLIKLLNICNNAVNFDRTYRKTPTEFKNEFDVFFKEAYPFFDTKDIW